LPENSVLTIEVGLGSMAKKKLTAAGVSTGMGHRQAAGLMFVAVDLTGDRVARTAGAGLAPCSFPAVGTAALGHEAIDDAMEAEPVIETLVGELDEVGHGSGGIAIEKLQLDRARFGVH